MIIVTLFIACRMDLTVKAGIRNSLKGLNSFIIINENKFLTKFNLNLKKKKKNEFCILNFKIKSQQNHLRFPKLICKLYHTSSPNVHLDEYLYLFLSLIIRSMMPIITPGVTCWPHIRNSSTTSPGVKTSSIRHQPS